jgi:predicted XRE-type DNA-binding protein
VPNGDEHFVKAQLVEKIDTILKGRGLNQSETAQLFSVSQLDVSRMLRGDFRQFSIERLMRFLIALDQDVEIVVKPHRDAKNAPALHVS